MSRKIERYKERYKDTYTQGNREPTVPTERVANKKGHYSGPALAGTLFHQSPMVQVQPHESNAKIITEFRTKYGLIGLDSQVVINFQSK